MPLPWIQPIQLVSTIKSFVYSIHYFKMMLPIESIEMIELMSVRNSSHSLPFKSRRSSFLLLLHRLSLMLFYIASSISVDLLMDNYLCGSLPPVL